MICEFVSPHLAAKSIIAPHLTPPPLALYRHHRRPSGASPHLAPLPSLTARPPPRADSRPRVLASGWAVREVLDEAIPPLRRHAAVWAASTLSTPAPGLDSCLIVPCEEERIPRCGRRPAKLIKFTLGLQLVFRKQIMFAQSSPVGLHKEAKSLHLVCNWCAGSQKQFALGLPSR